MTRRSLRLTLMIAVLAIVAAYFVVTRRSPSENHAEQHVTISGNYSDDWMRLCGPVQGSKQKSCTANLDAAYGRAEGKPVPAETKDDGPKGK